MKRQRGRNRGGGGGGGGGKPQQQNANRAFDSNGPDGVKVRGNAQHVFEKYQQLARDATSAGDRVLAENYLQHAEHYFRLLRALQPQRPASEILGRDQFASGYDIDFEDEGAQAQSEAADEAAENAEVEGGGAEAREQNRWQDRPRERDGRDNREGRDREGREREGREREGRDRDRGERFEGRRDRDDRDANRDNREGREGGRRDRWRDRDGRDRNNNEPRAGDQPREPREPRGERGERGEDRRERFNREDRPEREPVSERQQEPVAAVAEERPSPVLRDAEGGESHAPAFLQAAAPRTEGDEPAKRPRRRRAPRSFEGGADAPSGEPEEA